MKTDYLCFLNTSSKSCTFFQSEAELQMLEVPQGGTRIPHRFLLPRNPRSNQLSWLALMPCDRCLVLPTQAKRAGLKWVLWGDQCKETRHCYGKEEFLVATVKNVHQPSGLMSSYILRVLKVRVWNGSPWAKIKVSFWRFQDENLCPCLAHSLACGFLPPSSKPAAQRCPSLMKISASDVTSLSLTLLPPSDKNLRWHWAHLDGPGLLPHCRTEWYLRVPFSI